jgi:hypothetical protein
MSVTRLVPSMSSSATTRNPKMIVVDVHQFCRPSDRENVLTFTEAHDGIAVPGCEFDRVDWRIGRVEKPHKGPP